MSARIADPARRAAAAGVFLWAALGVAEAQTVPPSVVDEVTGRYLALVTEYQSGDAARAVTALVHWSLADLQFVRPRTPWPPDVLRAAALIETEAAFASGVTFQDMGMRLGRAEGWLTESERRAPRNAANAFRRQWDRQVGRRLLWSGFVAVARRILEAACQRFPDDGELHLALGTALEALASDSGFDPAAPGDAALTARRLTQDTMIRAKFAFEKAVAARNGPLEARLRLAHLLVLEGNDTRATPLLETVSAAPALPTEMTYLAAIMLGEIQARRGDLAGAEKLFAGAQARVPSAQSAFLAHAHALRDAGQTEAAAAVLEDMLRRPKATTDPWRRYLLGFVEEMPRFDHLRDEVRR